MQSAFFYDQAAMPAVRSHASIQGTLIFFSAPAVCQTRLQSAAEVKSAVTRGEAFWNRMKCLLSDRMCDSEVHLQP